MSVDLQGLVVLLLFIAPGFLYSRAYLAARPRYRREPNLFEQTVLAVVGSTLIHASLIGILALGVLIYTILARSAPSVQDLFSIPATLPDAPISIVATYSLIAAIYITISLMLAQRIGAWLGDLISKHPHWHRFLPGGDPPEQVLLWYRTLVEEPLKRGISRPCVVAWLRSGERFEGNLAAFHLSADEGNVIELALEDATFQANKSQASRSGRLRFWGSRTPGPMPLSHHRVLLRSSDILWLSRVDATEKGEAV
jgi:hypothetical protein